MDKIIEFDENLSILVGINGSGKTSILNLLNWIISPSLSDLCVTEFKTAKLLFKIKGTQYEINCKHSKDYFHYAVKSQEKSYQPLKVRLHLPASKIKHDENLRFDLIQNYQNLSPEPGEEDTWNLIGKFQSPTIIGLDRNLFAEESPDRYFVDDGGAFRHRRLIGRSEKSPLDRVRGIINVEYRKRKNDILNLTNRLKNQLMLSAFDGIVINEGLELSVRNKLNLNQIESAKKRVNDYFKNFEKNSISEEDLLSIDNYFAQLKEVTEKYQEDTNDINSLIFAINANQFTKIKKLLSEFEKFESRTVKAMEEIHKYIETLNYFLHDSAKQLAFKEDTSELVFNTIDRLGNTLTEHNDINFLSSGEQQLLILFSYIAFTNKDGRLFIIDEPELSLHIWWQENFLEKLSDITPKGTQLILATHSPILANKGKDKTRLLLPYNE